MPYRPMLKLRAWSLFWSILKMVILGRSPMVSGRYSIEFWLRWKSVKLAWKQGLEFLASS